MAVVRRRRGAKRACEPAAGPAAKRPRQGPPRGADDEASTEADSAEERREAPAEFSETEDEEDRLVLWAGRDRPNRIACVWDASQEEAALLCSEARQAMAVAFDVEWKPDRGKGTDNPAAVLQLAFESGSVFVLQLQWLKPLPREVQDLLWRPGCRRVGFGTSRDVNKLVRAGVKLGAVEDLQPRCRQHYGSPEFQPGLRHMSLSLLGYDMPKDKKVTCSDWSCTELTPQQVEYAAMDAWVTLRLFWAMDLN